MPDPLVSLVLVLGLLWALSTLGGLLQDHDPADETPTLLQDLVFILSLVYILRYVRNRRE